MKIVIVVDASVLAPALADDGEDGEDGDRARSRLSGQELAAPELIDLEVLSVLRKQRSVGLINDRRVSLALVDLVDLVDLPISRARPSALLGRAWELNLWMPSW